MMVGTNVRGGRGNTSSLIAATILCATAAQGTAAAANQTPTADAGADRFLEGGATSLTLSGSGSDDGSIESWRWTQLNGPSATLTGTRRADLDVSGLTEGFYRFQLTVTDDRGATNSDVVRVFVPGNDDHSGPVGELRRWHNLVFTFDGIQTRESATPNPFLDYRMTMFFVHPESGTSYAVPGYYAADGDAAESSATTGKKWRAHFVPDRTGNWQYWASFRSGNQIAIASESEDGEALAFDGSYGSFEVAETNKSGRDFRSKGLLQYVGGHFLQFKGTGEYFLKGGADSPENFLAYAEFDQTPKQSHFYTPHAGDYASLGGGDTWQGNKGRNIFGALNYLSSKGMNSVYFLTMNVGGDGDDVWPWTSPTNRREYDCSKLDQWERVFTHMDQKGLMLHVITQETENDDLLDGGNLGVERQLYFRELIARFSHHLAVTWNLGEENTNDGEARREFYDFFRANDPYRHHVVVHTYPSDREEVYSEQLDLSSLDGASLQIAAVGDTHSETKRWLDESESHGTPWVVTLDEIGWSYAGVLPDSVDPTHNKPRRRGMWGNLMAGGAGCEWYFGYDYEHNDLTCEDWRSRDRMWDYTRIGLEFIRKNVPFTEMKHADHLVTGPEKDNFCSRKGDELYLVFLGEGGTETLDLGSNNQSTYTVRWFNTREGGSLQTGSKSTLSGTGPQSLGTPPQDDDEDWLAFVQKSTTQPTILDVNVTPDPFVGPSDFTLEVMVDDADGADDVRVVHAFFFAPDGTFVGRLTPQLRSDGTFRERINSLNGLESGEWTFVVYASDQAGAVTKRTDLSFWVE